MHSVSHWLASVGWGLLALFALAAILAPWLSSHDPSTMDGPMLSPSASHPLGTNDIGQDIFSELLYGARFSLLVGCLAAGLSTTVGVVLGVVAGYYDKPGFAIMRVVDVFLAVPRFPLIVFLAAFLKPGFWTLVLFFLLFGWTKTTRLVRSQILSERHNGYVEAAVAVGAGDLRILGRHLLPGTLSIALVRFIVEFQHVILAESGLSFLGLGDPTAKSWGAILRYAFEYPTIFISNVWVRWAAPPGICITLVVLALTFVGFSLEEWANPRLSGARKRAWWNRPNDLAKLRILLLPHWIEHNEGHAAGFRKWAEKARDLGLEAVAGQIGVAVEQMTACGQALVAALKELEK